MATVTLPDQKARERAPIVGEFAPPPYALSELPDPSDLPKDEIAREIVLLLSRHPEISADYVGTNFSVLPRVTRETILKTIKAKIGILPVRRRHLGYVGP